MALQELQAMQTAFELLSPLDASAQQRVLVWLSAALADTNGGPVSADNPGAGMPSNIASEDVVAGTPTQYPGTLPGHQTLAPVAAAGERGAEAEPQVAAEPGSGPVDEPVSAARPARTRAAKSTGRRAGKTGKASAAATSAPVVRTASGRRSERPSGEQFLTDLNTLGSFKALAEEYGKSIGTIGNWANQLREQGFAIPVGRQKKA
ncbi:hypothetical protein ACWT_5784 [Actinoplanes sp. SE50]|uniref:hypothetical protein n=1 Tax=unclassified Actinoplanes TaxID=2626549 RepID=UPI00023ED68D|nr:MULTISPECIES: hypothetical protein [unclassified Actinoplanes]AEV86802.1 hypothetical protein ACPL_5915 [Actinoplanes sp. SE50/110]ATO85199.1 hypothetical protein ACWT_5784 [Actinoplanes sp. SE50]SLM02609.1 hypothetical protein ACSP50_5891 [Actinoplanes sp. SE50/110]